MKQLEKIMEGVKLKLVLTTFFAFWFRTTIPFPSCPSAQSHSGCTLVQFIITINLMFSIIWYKCARQLNTETLSDLICQ